MRNLFLPDDYQRDIYCYNAEYLSLRGIRFLMCDIDNTLVTYDDPEPTESLLAWIHELHAAGIEIGFISNNTAERVELFNRSLGFIAYPDAHKPLTGTMKQFLSQTSYKKEEIAHVGDQIFTDVCMAHACDLTALLLPPIKDKKTLFFRIKRVLEKPFLAYYLHKKKA